MKKAILILTMIVSTNLIAQINIPPSPGERHSYFLNGNEWETYISSSKIKFALKTFDDGESYSMWILNFSLKESELKKLANYLDQLPELNIIMNSKTSSDNGKTWYVDSFEIHGKDVYEMPVGKETKPNLNLVMEKIRHYFNG